MNQNPTLPRSQDLMSRQDTALLVVDMQVKLLPLIRDHTRLLWNVRRLVDAAAILEIPAAATEQYPQGLGATVDLLAQRLPRPAEKLAFSCTACPELFGDWVAQGRDKILVTGIEAHVCVQQTALDLLASGFRVYVAADATGSRHEPDWRFALDRMSAAGVTVTTTEAALFEWCEVAGNETFKRISSLVREFPPPPGGSP